MVLNRVNGTNRGIGSSTAAGVEMHSKRIQAGLNTQIVIQVEDENGGQYTVGAIQSIAITESRTNTAITELGTDANIGMVPTSATTYSGALTRLVFDFQRLPQALQREYRHIHAQRRPFDIVITDYNPYITNSGQPEEGEAFGGGSATVSSTDGSIAGTKYSTRLKNCWFNSLAVTYATNSYLISESANFDFQAIWDEGDGASVNTVGGPKDSLERTANTSSAASILSAANASRNP